MNFQEVLQTKVAEIERPPLPPLGTYRMQITKVPEFGDVSSDKGEWDTVRFPLQALEAVAVPDFEAVDTFGLKNITLSYQFMYDRHDAVKQDQTKFRMKQFLSKTLGIEEGKKNLAEMMNESVGKELLVSIKYRPDPNDPEIMYAEVGKVAPLS